MFEAAMSENSCTGPGFQACPQDPRKSHCVDLQRAKEDVYQLREQVRNSYRVSEALMHVIRCVRVDGWGHGYKLDLRAFEFGNTGGKFDWIKKIIDASIAGRHDGESAGAGRGFNLGRCCDGKEEVTQATHEE